MAPLELSTGIWDQMLAHAREEWPKEAVGLLGGDRYERACLAIRLRNIAGPQAFLADPYSQYEAERKLADAGCRLLAIYHSHPGGAAAPSPSDLQFARPWQCAMLIIALARAGLEDEIRGYRLQGGHASEIDIVVL